MTIESIRDEDTNFGWRIGVDIGGTFTDIVALTPERRIIQGKVPTTHGAYADAITQGLGILSEKQALGRVSAFIHGTTVATNAVLEEEPQAIALITTKGMRDVLELRRARRPDLYDLDWTPPASLVRRDLRFEVEERIAANGDIVTQLDEEDLQRCIRSIAEHQIEAVAICLLNSYANPVHERIVAERLQQALPDVRVTYSADIAPEIKEYERTSTVVVNAFLLPVIKDYLFTLEGALRDMGIDAPPQVMQSDGTTASAALVRERPFLIIESGPAAGAVAAARLALELGDDHVIAFDMGGTTAKATLIEHGKLALSDELEIGSSINRGGGHMRGAGHVVRSPCVDLTEVGSGGGSIAWVDKGGTLRVGPKSTGSMPGPACYGLGGTEATVTDAHLVLGYLDPHAIAGGNRQIHLDRALEAVGKLAAQLGVSTLDAAYGIYLVATAAMRRAVRAVTIERGRDPRTFTLYSFGGGGGLHAAALAADLEIGKVIAPIAPGLFSSLGLLLSNIGVTRVLACFGDLGTEQVRALMANIDNESGLARAELLEQRNIGTDLVVEAFVALRCKGQSSTIELAVGLDSDADAQLAEFVMAFDREYLRINGQHRNSQDLEIVSARVRVSAPAPEIRYAELAPSYLGTAADTPLGKRDMYFGPKIGLRSTPVIKRSYLAGRQMTGPLVIQEEDTTIVVPPDFTCSLHASGSLVIETPAQVI